MAIKQKRKRSMFAKKRTHKRRGYRKRKTVTTYVNPRAGLPLPPKFRTTLTYSQQGVTGNGGTATLSTYQYALNSVYDPYVTAGGHQPMGYDQLTNFYQFCRVYGAKVTVTFTPGTGTSNNPYVGIQFSENSSYSPSTLSEVIERGNCVYAMLPNQPGCTKQITLKKGWSAKKWWNGVYSKDQSNANTASNGPTGELAYCNVFALPPTSGVNYSDCYYNIKIEYYVEFYGQLQLNQS